MNLFQASKVEHISTTLSSLKKNTSDWVIALDSKNWELQKRVDELERRLRVLEILRRQ